MNAIVSPYVQRRNRAGEDIQKTFQKKWPKTTILVSRTVAAMADFC